MPTNHHLHMLRLVLSCRKVTAQVTDPATSTIVAMASSTEPEFLPEFRAKQERFPRLRFLWDARTATRVGEKLAFRLREIGIPGVHIDADEEILRPVHYRKKALPFFDSVRRAGVEIHGAERLGEIGPVTVKV
ncbi:hypothetical protein HS088_TW16G00335 [Tripterygium wilfordii]|uniref:Uncharacterized protein n=2 Tax=Tripterygium wilfordii TaxID=458696 RepID=A0A7J7CIK2_TRIWF|nr:hypothetical protein HS088_TW16G00318 [Tripterygium wilfordii]KAF5733894.1 hypothetical protein HS088_TW16G00335 [Tripterygium wilfordii]